MTDYMYPHAKPDHRMSGMKSRFEQSVGFHGVIKVHRKTYNSGSSAEQTIV